MRATRRVAGGLAILAAVLDRVRELNADGGIVVHAIGIGEDHDAEFMRAIARQNSGEYHSRGAGPN